MSTDFLSDFLGFGSRPPESVARKVFGIGTMHALDREGVLAAFRFRIKLLRPDLTDAAADALRLRHIAPEGSSENGYEVRFDGGSTQEQLAELLWAREELLDRVREAEPAQAAAANGGSLRLSSADTRGAARIRNRVEGESKAPETAEQYEEHRRLVNGGESCFDCGCELPEVVYQRVRRTFIWNGLLCYEERRVCLCERCAGWTESWERESLQADLRPWRYESGQEPVQRGDCESCGRAIFSFRGDESQRWNRPRYRVCSPRCYERLRSEARAERRSSLRRRSCQICGDEFTPARSDGRYCSPACRQRAYRERTGAP